MAEDNLDQEDSVFFDPAIWRESKTEQGVLIQRRGKRMMTKVEQRDIAKWKRIKAIKRELAGLPPKKKKVRKTKNKTRLGKKIVQLQQVNKKPLSFLDINKSNNILGSERNLLSL